MIIWRGWGVLTIAIVVLVGGLVTAISVNVLKETGRFVGLAFTAGLVAAALVNWFVGRRLNSAPGRELMDPATGQRVVLRRSHDLFFVPMEWWSVLLLIGALISFFAVLFGSEPTLRHTVLPVGR